MADLTAHDPNDPYPADGTQMGVATDASTSKGENALDNSKSFHSTCWITTYNWPELLITLFSNCDLTSMAWFTFDTLRNSLTGITDCARAFAVSIGLSLAFFGIIEGMISVAIEAGVDKSEILEYFLATLIYFGFHLCWQSVVNYNTFFLKIGYYAALVTTNMLQVDTWNPITGIGRIAFILSTLGYLLYKIDYYEDLIYG